MAQSYGAVRSPDDMDDDERRKIAHRLLVELLAYQFAFPVKWIDTQETLLSKSPSIRRFVEFGATKVLGGLMRRTLESKYGSKELFQVLAPDYGFLSCEQDLERLRYTYPQAETEAPCQTEEQVDVVALKADQQLLQNLFTTGPETQPLILQSIAEAEIPVQLIIAALIAYKLKKRWSEIKLDRSLKELSGGRSTMQNELVSDLSLEFGNLPDGLEDLSLASLSSNIQCTHGGKLGKQSNLLIAKFISSKMPSGWNQNAVRSHLQERWGLGPLRQDAVLLLAVTSEPPSRLASPDLTEQFFESLVQAYASDQGISLAVVHPSEDVRPPSHAVVVDATQLRGLEAKHDRLADRLRAALRDEMQGSAGSMLEEQLEKSYSVQLQLQRRIDLWCSEFSDDFELGIKPVFDANKSRRFKSVWNTARLDVLKLVRKMELGEQCYSDRELETVALSLTNKTDSTLETMITMLLCNAIHASEKEQEPSTTVSRLLKKGLSDDRPPCPVYKHLDPPMAPRTTVNADGSIEVADTPRGESSHRIGYASLVERQLLLTGVNIPSHTPCVHIKRRATEGWSIDQRLTTMYHSAIRDATSKGLSFAGKDVLVTGAGIGSIAIEVVRGLLMGGARVIMTSSRPPAALSRSCQQLFEKHGSTGSELLVFPFNQGSKQDCEALIEHIYSDQGLGRSLDAVFPFAAISDNGKDIEGVDARSELSLRLMMVNVIRLLGAIVRQKRTRQIRARPTSAVIPLSSNHGMFGGDGLYAESKLGLESLLDRFTSEDWQDYLLIHGAVIGWTRGTGLMNANGLVAEAIEKHGVTTFSTSEMALNLLALLSERVDSAAEAAPIWVDLNGGLQFLPDLKVKVVQARADMAKKSAVKRAIMEQDAIESIIIQGSQLPTPPVHPGSTRSNSNIGYPRLPDQEVLDRLVHLQNMVNPEGVIVVVGFSELGPWGGSRTRWERESRKGLTTEGYIELAWMMGLVKHFDGHGKDGKHYAGWVDSQSGDPVRDDEVGERYGTKISRHTGIRLVDADINGGFDPDAKEYLQEIIVEEDLPAFDATRVTAEAFKVRHGDKAAIWRCGEADEFKVQLKRGATVMVPKTSQFNSLVAGQIPNGFDASIFGVPEDIIAQVDPVTLYALCCCAEALYSAGIIDSYELFQHMHISELGLFLGSSLGGLTKTRQMYRDRYLDRLVPGDVIQETNFNTPSAWINMLLMGSAGPIKTSTGACATSVESLDAACDSILAGKTKLCVVGGVDDLIEEDAFAFSTMKATVDARDQLDKGRLANEMSRPMSESRAGFVESHGCGVQLVCTAELALKMGLPIYAVIASSTMAADGISRSVPAPGQGVLSFAREAPEAAQSSWLDLDYRREHMESFTKQDPAAVLDSTSDNEYFSSSHLSTPPSSISTTESTSPASCLSPKQPISIQAVTGLDYRKLAQTIYGNNFRALDPGISPIRAALAVWGLGIDDIGMISMHGTSTRANDKNESHVIQQQMDHLGRTVGNPIPVICQKSLTGHPKAAAAAWMLNGCLQAMNDNLIPGNQVLDTVDDELRQFHHLVFPTESLDVREIKAFLLDSFGFGQKGGQVVGIAPKYLFATLRREAMAEYRTKVIIRKRVGKREYIRAMATNSIVKIKSAPPYDKSATSATYLNPAARSA